jgi:hypothetical protein
MQTKLNNKTLEFYAKVFSKTSLSGRQALLATMMQKYPEYYQEFVDVLDKKLYIKHTFRGSEHGWRNVHVVPPER